MNQDASEIIKENRVEVDRSGVGHAWRLAINLPAGIAEEIAAWIIEDQPAPGDEMAAGNGYRYRLPPKA